MATLKVKDNMIVSYEDYGSGPVVMLLHSSPGNSKMWQRVGDRLSDRFRIIAPDLPGYGKTTPQDPSISPNLSYTAALIEALISVIGPPLVLAGHSYGGVVALNGALANPKIAKGVALFEPVAIPILSAIGENDAYAYAKAFFDGYISGFEAGDNQAVRKMIDFWFGPGTFEKMPPSLKDYLFTNTALNILDVRATFRTRYSIESLRNLNVPLLVVYGKRSPEVTLKIASSIATHTKRGSLVGLENATHALTTTHVEEVTALIAEFANKCASPDAPEDASSGAPMN
jgi:pimeloyl-ACP methyl ester carboxylesterase